MVRLTGGSTLAQDMNKQERDRCTVSAGAHI
jgi:hypothetical protein